MLKDQRENHIIISIDIEDALDNAAFLHDKENLTKKEMKRKLLNKINVPVQTPEQI